MIYLGCTARHWREEYKGDWYTQCFLHYVRSRGDKVHAVFDSDQTENQLQSWHKTIFKSQGSYKRRKDRRRETKSFR